MESSVSVGILFRKGRYYHWYCSLRAPFLHPSIAYTQGVNAQSYLRPGSADPGSCELFVVEGKSAADAINNVRSKRTQAIYAMQGKMPNPAKHSLKKLLTNPHCEGLFSTLGFRTTDQADGDHSPHGKFELRNMPYKKVLLLGDADIDGRHSLNMLLDLFNRYFPDLIEASLLYRIEAPAYRITDPDSTGYLYSELEKLQWLAHASEDPTENRQLSQLKGIAAMSNDEISTLLISPETRRESLIQTSSGSDDKTSRDKQILAHQHEQWEAGHD